MTGYQSKKKAALDEEGMYLVHQTDHSEDILHMVAHPAQEPVAYWNFNNGFSHCMIDQLNEAAKKNPAPLYTTPPQRPWVGIDWSEIPDEQFDNYHFGDGAKWAEQHLKEKNNG